MLTTNLANISHHANEIDYNKLLDHLGANRSKYAPIPFAKLVESNGIDEAIFLCRAEPRYARIWREYAVRCADTFKDRMDSDSLAALEVARQHADECISSKDLQQAFEKAVAVSDRLSSLLSETVEGPISKLKQNSEKLKAANMVAWATLGNAALAAQGASTALPKALRTSLFLEAVA